MDKYWGAFATPNAKLIVNKTWKGANRLGLILMDLRSELRREHPEIAREETSNQTAVQDGAIGGQVPVDPHSSSSSQLTYTTKPTPPERPKKAARKQDEVSPLTFPPVARQKTGSVPNSAVGSPTCTGIVLPVGDLFEPVGNTYVTTGQHNPSKVNSEAETTSGDL